jgi:hypothetical protein
MKSKRRYIILIVVLVAAVAWQWHTANKWRSEHAAMLEEIRIQRQHLERLSTERDSILFALRRREGHYLAVADSLNIVIDRLQHRQTQNTQQYENTRLRVDTMPDNRLYRFVSNYINRYADSIQH